MKTETSTPSTAESSTDQSTTLPLQVVCELARNIPCSLDLLPRLLACLNSGKATADDLVEIIQQDPGLAANTLRLANSAGFSNGTRCDSLRDAVLLLGRYEIFRFAATILAGQWLRHDVSGYGWEPGDLYKHSMCVAVAAQVLAKDETNKKLNVDPSVAFTAGLIHDLGKLIIAYVLGADQFEDIRKFQEKEECSWRKAEHQLLGYDHTDIGGTLLMGWNYPANLVQVVCYYSRPKLASKQEYELVTLIHAAKQLALMIGTGVGEDGFLGEIDTEALAEFDFTPERLEDALPEVLSEMERVMGQASITKLEL